MITGFYEDIEVGDETVTRGRTLTETDIVVFASLSGDWHPLHTNLEHAEKGPFGERIGHGMLALSITTGLVELHHESVLAFYGIDRLRFVKPAFIHDTLSARTRVVDKADRDERSGNVTVEVNLCNQRDEVVLAATFRFLVARSEQ